MAASIKKTTSKKTTGASLAAAAGLSSSSKKSDWKDEVMRLVDAGNTADAKKLLAEWAKTVYSTPPTRGPYITAQNYINGIKPGSKPTTNARTGLLTALNNFETQLQEFSAGYSPDQIVSIFDEFCTVRRLLVSVFKDSDFVKEIRKYDNESANIIYRNARLYWGDQPIVAAPAYIGISVFYIFLISLFFIDKKHLRWIIPSLIFSLILSWGKNFSFVTDLMIDYFPFYNKFRAVSSIQVIIEFIIPFIAALGLYKYFQKERINSDKFKLLAYTSFGFLFLLTLMLLFGSQIFGFKSEIEVFSNYPEILDLIIKERQEVFKSDLIRSIMIVLILSIIFWANSKNFLKRRYSLFLITVIVLIDLWNINMKYVNEENFTTASKVKNPFTINEIDKEIIKDDSHFRVYEPYRGFVNGRSSFFHNSISGYHAAKPKRIQDLYDFYLSKNKFNVLNMLNVKYLIDLNENNSLSFSVNKENLGNAWFIENLVNVESSNKEILMLDNLDYSKECLSTELESKTYIQNSNDRIDLIDRKANELVYEYDSSSKNFIVFSEAYYSNGWDAYIDGEKVDHSKVNYLLRGMEVPKGKHNIKFVFKPDVIKKGSFIMGSSNFILLILIVLYFKRKLSNV